MLQSQMSTKNKTYYLNSNGTRVNSKKTFLKFLNFYHKRKLFHVIDRIPFVAVHPPFVGQIHGLTKMISYLSTSTKKKTICKTNADCKTKKICRRKNSYKNDQFKCLSKPMSVLRPSNVVENDFEKVYYNEEKPSIYLQIDINSIKKFLMNHFKLKIKTKHLILEKPFQPGLHLIGTKNSRTYTSLLEINQNYSVEDHKIVTFEWDEQIVRITNNENKIQMFGKIVDSSEQTLGNSLIEIQKVEKNEKQLQFNLIVEYETKFSRSIKKKKRLISKE